MWFNAKFLYEYKFMAWVSRIVGAWFFFFHFWPRVPGSLKVRFTGRLPSMNNAWDPDAESKRRANSPGVAGSLLSLKKKKIK